MEEEEGKVHKFFNDYKIEKKKLKIRAQNTHYLCLLQCLGDPKYFRSRLCEKLCQDDFERYMKFKEDIKVQDPSKYMYEGRVPPKNSDPKLQEAYDEYQRHVSQSQAQLADNVKRLQIYLEELEGKYAGPFK